VILMCRRSPARRGLGANAPQVLQRAAELIPDQLKFSAPSRLHPWGLTRRKASRIPPRAVGPRTTEFYQRGIVQGGKGFRAHFRRAGLRCPQIRAVRDEFRSVPMP